MSGPLVHARATYACIICHLCISQGAFCSVRKKYLVENSKEIKK